MSELIKQILALYAAAGGATLRGLTPGGMWLTTAPQGSSGVYIIVTPVAAPVEYAMSTSATKPYTQDCDVQFTLSTESGAAGDVVAAMAALKALYDFCTFTMTGETLLVARRINEAGPVRDFMSHGYEAHVEYRFMVGA